MRLKHIEQFSDSLSEYLFVALLTNTQRRKANKKDRTHVVYVLLKK